MNLAMLENTTESGLRKFFNVKFLIVFSPFLVLLATDLFFGIESSVYQFVWIAVKIYIGIATAIIVYRFLRRRENVQGLNFSKIAVSSIITTAACLLWVVVWFFSLSRISGYSVPIVFFLLIFIFGGGFLALPAYFWSRGRRSEAIGTILPLLILVGVSWLFSL